MKYTEKIGILGGTFDPIHKGHIAFAEAAYSECALDCVLFMPAFIPVFKLNQSITPAEKRLEMVKLAISSTPYFKTCDAELRRKGKTYTIDTLKALSKEMPNSELFFLASSDAAQTISTWKDGLEIPNYAHIVTNKRPGSKWADDFNKKNLDGKFKHVLIKDSILDISSTEIREAVQAKKSITQFVGKSVAQYIKKHNLYT